MQVLITRRRALRSSRLLMVRPRRHADRFDGDLGAEKRTEWGEETLFKLLNYRYRQQLPTAESSNFWPGDLEPRIASRLQDVTLGAALLMSGLDHRLTGRRR